MSSEQHEVIKSFVSSLDYTYLKGNPAVNEAIQNSSNFSGLEDLINKFVADLRKSSNGDEFLKKYCGIDLDNEDTGAITGSDAGGDVVKTAISVVPEDGEAEESTLPNSTSITYNGLTLSYPNINSLTETQQNIIAGINTWWLKNGLDLAEETFGLSFTESDATFRKINIDFDVSDSDSSGYFTYHYNKNNGKITAVTWHINSDHYEPLSTTDVNGISTYSNTHYGTPNYLDKTIALSLGHLLIMANMNYHYLLPSFVSQGFGGLVTGKDDGSKSKPIMEELSEDVDKFIQFTLNNNRNSMGIRSTDAYDAAAGYMLMRYFAKNANRDYTSDTINYDEDNVISNFNDYAVIEAGKGNDIVYNWDSTASIYGGADNDTIENFSSAYYDTGKDSYVKNTLLDGGAGNDYILNTNVDATINGGIGNDTVSILGGNALIQYADGDGNDVIFGYTYDETINITKGTIGSTYKSGDDAIIEVGSGSIRLVNPTTSTVNIIDENGQYNYLDFDNASSEDTTPADTTPADTTPADTTPADTTPADTTPADTTPAADIYGTDGDDTIYNVDDNVKIDVLAGNDYVDNRGTNVSIYGGTGNDEMSIWKKAIAYGGDGNDQISVWNHLVEGAKYTDYSTIDGGAGDDYLDNRADYVYINGGSGNDEINSDGYDSTIDGGDGNDDILYNSSKVSIKAGAGNDTIIYCVSSEYNGNYKSYFDGGDDEDYIETSGEDITIKGGKGNDIINNGFVNCGFGTDWKLYLPERAVIDAGEGNDSVSNSSDYSTITGGLGDDTINLKDKDYTVNFEDTYHYLTNYNVINYNSGDGNDVIYGFNSTDTLNIAKGSSYSTQISGSDTIIKVGNGSITLKDYSENLNIIGTYAGSTDTTPSDDTLPSDDTIPSVDTIPTDVTPVYKDGFWDFRNTTTPMAVRDSTNGKLIVYLNNVGGNIFSASEEASGDKIVYAGSGGDQLYNNNSKVNVSFNGGAGNDTITNSKGNSNATIIGNGGNDLISLTGSTGNVIQYSSGDGNDTINGYDSTDKIQIVDTNYTTSQSGQDVIITVGNGSIRLVNAKGKTLNINGEQGTNVTDNLVVGNDDKSPVKVDSAIKTIDARDRTKTLKITANDLNNTIFGGTKVDSIRGGAGNDSILGNAGNDKLFGEAGADTLIGGKNNDTLTGGAGKDVFVYSNGDGKDVIADYTSNEDKIKIDSGTISKVSLSGSDVVLKIGSGSIKVKKAKDKALTIVNANGVSSVATFTDTLKLTNSSAASIKVTDSLIKTIDASSRTKAINITGNSNANTITGSKSNDTLTGGSGKDTFIYTGGNDIITDYAVNQDKLKISTGTLKSANISGNDVVLKVNSNSIKVKGAKNKAISIADSKNNNFALLVGSTAADKLNGTSAADSILGGAGNDTLTGNKGNDTLTGGAGRDVFVYKLGDGNDTITDYTAGQDTILLTGSYTQSTVGNNVILKIGSGSLTLRNVKGRKLSITTPTTSNKNFIEEHWFTEDNNFIVNDINSITDKKEIFTKDDAHYSYEGMQSILEMQISPFDQQLRSNNRTISSTQAKS